MIVRESSLSGCFEIIPQIFSDERGLFVKTFQCEIFAQHGLVDSFAEEFYSWSNRDVLRGLHFQIPPAEHTKVVTCLSGKVLDVVVDLRIGSPTFGQHELFTLREGDTTMLYIPSGLAHGFLTLSDKALMYYQVTSIHNPEYDKGIHWDSAGIAWPIISPVVSARDAALPDLDNFDSPFIFQPTIPK